MDVFDAMETCGAMRYLKPDPVPEDLIRKVLHAATRASNPGNSQGWDFVVVRDPDLKARIGKPLRETMHPILDGMADGDPSPRGKRMYGSVKSLLDAFDTIPVCIFVCGRAVYPTANPMPELIPAALYPAAQNLIVAARALGLGTTFTTFHQVIEPVVREALEIPADVQLGVMVAMGWPERSFRPVRRKPLDQVVHWDRW